MKAALITVVEHKEVVPANGKTFTMEELQSHVRGYFELVSIPLNPQLLMVVNEDGHSEGLLPNQCATNLAQQRIVGPVLVCDRRMIE